MKGHKEVLSLSSDPEVCSFWFEASIEQNFVLYFFCIVQNLTGRCTVYNSVFTEVNFRGGFDNNFCSELQSQFGIRFDDVRWQNHINSLKPLVRTLILFSITINQN